eukprot:CAMPEP_0182438338 /NCGR_PEP_ID=MMETSP1167-20130531/85691_1 /TAXON_ID=2988 /ORGANISM="Mallomonas Sp, Strain CCMP3275" /LENGTH=31 /DNA_ID= /DNA_START= /DNA_END= /DNA_ORIENTATION=
MSEEKKCLLDHFCVLKHSADLSLMRSTRPIP